MTNDQKTEIFNCLHTIGASLARIADTKDILVGYNGHNYVITLDDKKSIHDWEGSVIKINSVADVMKHIL